MRQLERRHSPTLLGLEALEDRIALSSAADLDPTFASGGRIPGQYTFGADTVQIARSAPLADGSLILAGTPSVAKFVGVLHVQANGTLDPAFGTSGLTRVSFGVTGALDTVLGVSSFAGKILVGVEVQLDNLHVFLGAARLGSDGTLDTTFGSGGISIVAVDPDSSTFSGLAMGVTPAGGVVLLAGLQRVRPSNVLVQRRRRCRLLPVWPAGLGSAGRHLLTSGQRITRGGR